jgi:hypothetical protein
MQSNFQDQLYKKKSLWTLTYEMFESDSNNQRWSYGLIILIECRIFQPVHIWERSCLCSMRSTCSMIKSLNTSSLPFYRSEMGKSSHFLTWDGFWKLDLIWLVLGFHNQVTSQVKKMDTITFFIRLFLVLLKLASEIEPS